jgi:hypothetical protein
VARHTLKQRFMTLKRGGHSARARLCPPQAEQYFSRLRRAETGIHHRIAGVSAPVCAGGEFMAGGYPPRLGDQVNRIAHLALKRGQSVDFTGYWQRRVQ